MFGRLKKSLLAMGPGRRLHNAARRGATAVEMALLSGPFFLLLVGTMELGLIIGAQQILENTAYNTSRLIKTGSTSGANQAAQVTAELDNELSAYGTLFDTSQVTLTSYAYNDFALAAGGNGTSGYGTAQQIVVYTVTYPWKLFTPMMSAIIGTNGILNLNSTIVVRNEPYG